MSERRGCERGRGRGKGSDCDKVQVNLWQDRLDKTPIKHCSPALEEFIPPPQPPRIPN